MLILLKCHPLFKLQLIYRWFSWRKGYGSIWVNIYIYMYYIMYSLAPPLIQLSVQLMHSRSFTSGSSTIVHWNSFLPIIYQQNAQVDHPSLHKTYVNFRLNNSYYRLSVLHDVLLWRSLERLRQMEKWRRKYMGLLWGSNLSSHLFTWAT